MKKGIIINILKIGLIGTGTIADMHALALNNCSETELVAICSRNPLNLERRAREWGIKKCFTDYRELLADKEIGAVIIATPPKQHFPIAKAALMAGKDVLCEKPPTLNADEARELMKCAKSNGRLLMYGLMFRFSEKYRFVKEICDTGALGEIYYAKGSVLRRSDVHGGWFTKKELSGGGPIMDFGPHIIDIAVCFLGDCEPKSVYARCFKKTENLNEVKRHTGYRPIDPSPMENDIEEMDMAVINFQNGACLVIESSFLMHVKEDATNLELFGTKGGITVEPGLEIHTVFHEHLADITPVINCKEFEYQNSIDAEIAHFADCILHKTPCINTAENGCRLMRILDAVYASAESGQVVEI